MSKSDSVNPNFRVVYKSAAYLIVGAIPYQWRIPEALRKKIVEKLCVLNHEEHSLRDPHRWLCQEFLFPPPKTLDPPLPASALNTVYTIHDWDKDNTCVVYDVNINQLYRTPINPKYRSR